jgi:hypothetical protein
MVEQEQSINSLEEDKKKVVWIIHFFKKKSNLYVYQNQNKQNSQLS